MLELFWQDPTPLARITLLIAVIQSLLVRVSIFQENLCLQLYHYDNSQRGYQEKIKEYLISQTHFLQRCKERSEASYAPINSILGEFSF